MTRRDRGPVSKGEGPGHTGLAILIALVVGAVAVLVLLGYAAYDGIERPSPPPSPSPRAAAAPRLPASSPSPSPPASPAPSPPHSPAPTPVEPLAPANVQFVPSRGLSLPLKVLAIVVIPEVAAARRIASHK